MGISPVTDRLPIPQDTAGRPFGRDRPGITAQPYIYGQTSGETSKIGEMEARWGVPHPGIIHPGTHVALETSQTNQLMSYSGGGAVDIGHFPPPHHGYPGYAFDASYFSPARQMSNLPGEPMTNVQYPLQEQLLEGSNSGGDQMSFPQTNQPEPMRTRLSPGQYDPTTLGLGGPSASVGFAETPEQMHLQAIAMYPHLMGPRGHIPHATRGLNLVERYSPAMRVPLLRELLKGLTPTMVELLGELISGI